MLDLIITKEAIKVQVKVLRDYLKVVGIELKQSNAYEVIAKMYSFENWNTMNAILNKKIE